MRAKHTPHALPSFPVYSSAFVSPNQLVLGGGGGQSRSGIKNKLRLYRVDDHKTLELLDELELDRGEDAPMSMAAPSDGNEFVCGVNSSEEALKNGVNQNCRSYTVKDNKLALRDTTHTLKLQGSVDDFQKVTVFSLDGKLLAVAGTSDLALLNYPSLTPAAPAIHLEKGEIYDASFSTKTLVVATTVNLLVYSLPSSGEPKTKSPRKRKGGSSLKDLQLLKTIERPELPGKLGGSNFRAVRFHPSDDRILYTVNNAVPSKTRTKASARPAFVCKWSTETWTTTRVRKIGDRGATCFDISPNGRLLAFGSSDYTVGVLDANTLAPLLTILKAHEFPPTTIRFNPISTLLVSGSADNTVRVVTIPDQLGETSWSFWIIIFVAVLILIFSILAQQMHQARS